MCYRIIVSISIIVIILFYDCRSDRYNCYYKSIVLLLLLSLLLFLLITTIIISIRIIIIVIIWNRLVTHNRKRRARD